MVLSENTKYDIDSCPERQNIGLPDIVLLKNDRIRRDTAITSATNNNTNNVSSTGSIDNATISPSHPTPNTSIASENSTRDLNSKYYCDLGLLRTYKLLNLL